jgi:DNA replication licensing factor MCM6
MSRFDLFFVVLDEQDEATDLNIAKHIVGLHQHSNLDHSSSQPEYSTSELQRYIRYARALKPRLSEEASRYLVSAYKELRRGSVGEAASSYRVTVRQLEALIRLGEARARVDLEENITVKHVQEARRLLKQSIIHVSHEDVDLMADGEHDDDMQRMAEEAEAAAEAERQQQAQEGQQAGAKRVSSCSYDKFQKVTRSLVHYIRAHDVEESVGAAGLRQGDVIDWYLSQQDEIDTIEALAEERRLVRRIISRLINIDHALVVVSDPSETQEDSEGAAVRGGSDERMITVRHAYNVDAS